MKKEMAKEISTRLMAMYKGNNVTYRNDKGNGCAGPACITIDNNDDYKQLLRQLLDGRIVDRNETVTTDRDDNPVTAKQLIQDAINAHNDTAIVDDNDIIVEVTDDDNGWTGYFWIYSDHKFEDENFFLVYYM